MSLPPNEQSDLDENRPARRRIDPADMLMVPSARELASESKRSTARPPHRAAAGSPEPAGEPNDGGIPLAPRADVEAIDKGSATTQSPSTARDEQAEVRPVRSNATVIDDADAGQTEEPIVRGEDDAQEEEPDDDEIRQESERWAPKTFADTVVQGPEKRCRVCDKDLRGHRRYKDALGYLCAECEKEDRIRRVQCAECGKPVSPESLRPFGPVSICTRCWVDHENDPKLRIKRKVSTKKFEMVEKQNLLIIIGVAIVLLLFILIGALT